MNKVRAISTGALIWAFIFITFACLGYVPGIKDSLNQQMLIVSVLIIPYALLGATIFYKNGNKLHGFVATSIMSLTAIVLDAFITVPFVEIPNGGSYQSFFTFPLFWLLVTINTASIYFYWKLKVNRRETHLLEKDISPKF